MFFYWRPMTSVPPVFNSNPVYLWLVTLHSFFLSHNALILLQRPRSLRHSSWPVSRQHGGQSLLLHDLPHHPERISRLHRRFKNGPNPGWQYHSVHGPQSFCLQVSPVVLVHVVLSPFAGVLSKLYHDHFCLCLFVTIISSFQFDPLL